jgi:hypothetical protein
VQYLKIIISLIPYPFHPVPNAIPLTINRRILSDREIRQMAKDKEVIELK